MYLVVGKKQPPIWQNRLNSGFLQQLIWQLITYYEGVKYWSLKNFLCTQISGWFCQTTKSGSLLVFTGYDKVSHFFTE